MLLCYCKKCNVQVVIVDVRYERSLFSFNITRNINYCNVHHSRTRGRYNPCTVLADSRSRLQPSLSFALILQFLTPSLSASLITPSIHTRFGLSTHLLPSGLSEVIFLHGGLSCIRTICPAHLSLVILIVVTKSVSSYK